MRERELTMTQCAHEQSASCHPGLGGSLVRDKQHSLRTIGFVKPVTRSPPQSGLPPMITPGPRIVCVWIVWIWNPCYHDDDSVMLHSSFDDSSPGWIRWIMKLSPVTREALYKHQKYRGSSIIIFWKLLIDFGRPCNPLLDIKIHGEILWPG